MWKNISNFVEIFSDFLLLSSLLKEYCQNTKAPDNTYKLTLKHNIQNLIEKFLSLFPNNPILQESLILVNSDRNFCLRENYKEIYKDLEYSLKKEIEMKFRIGEANKVNYLLFITILSVFDRVFLPIYTAVAILVFLRLKISFSNIEQSILNLHKEILIITVIPLLLSIVITSILFLIGFLIIELRDISTSILKLRLLGKRILRKIFIFLELILILFLFYLIYLLIKNLIIVNSLDTLLSKVFAAALSIILEGLILLSIKEIYNIVFVKIAMISINLIIYINCALFIAYAFFKN